MANTSMTRGCRGRGARLERILARFGAFFFAMVLGWPSPAPAAPFAYVPNSGSGNTSVIDTATNTVVATIPGTGTNPGGMAMDPAGAFAYLADISNSAIYVIARATNTVAATIPIGGSSVALAVNPAGTRLYVSNRLGRSLDVVDTATRTVVASTPLGGSANPWAVAVNPAGTRAYVVDSGTSPSTGKLHVVDLATNTLLASLSLPVAATPYDVAVNSTGTRVYVAHEFLGISVIDPTTNTVVTTIGTGFQARYMALSPDGTRLYLANFGAAALAVFDLTTNLRIAMVPTGASTIAAAVEPTGANVYAISLGTGSVAVVDTATNAVVATIPVGLQPVTFGQFIGGAAAAAPPDTTPPTAVLDGPSTGTLGSPIALSGARSSDVGGTVASYAWSAVTRPAGAAAFASPVTSSSPSFSFTPDRVGLWVVQLVVTDSSGNASTPALLSITVPDTIAPTAVLDGPTTASAGSVVALSGSRSSDVGGTVVSYQWTATTRPGRALAFPSPVTTTTPSFSFTPDAAGTWIVQLVVRDSSGNASTPVSLSIAIASPDTTPPTAVLDGPASVAWGSAVTLSGARSSDVGGTVVSYQWSAATRPAGASAFATPATTATPSFSFTPDAAGMWVVQLVVTDSSGNASTPASLSFAILPPDTTAPTAVLDGPTTAAPGAAVTLSGARSTDVGGTVASYRWTAVTRPAGAAAFASPVTTTSPSFSFTPDVVGNWLVELVVTDNSGNVSRPTGILIAVISPDTTPPTAVLDGPATATAGIAIALSGARSSDVGGTIVSYQWSVTTRPPRARALASPVTTTLPSFKFTPDARGTWVVQLVVTDSSGNVSAPFSLSIAVVKVASLVVNGPTSVVAGSTVNFTVTAADASGNPVTPYAGTVHFTSSDGGAVLPADYTFIPATDGGTHWFSMKLNTVGTRTLNVADSASGISGSATVTVTAPPR
ncbi:MAG: hypothetical protein C3F16_05490 [Betaproteobacteria bacterium]|nr:MAG: hypothetical protein C3F16_05490 [Betaproteobacteria bacterium]